MPKLDGLVFNGTAYSLSDSYLNEIVTEDVNYVKDISASAHSGKLSNISVGCYGPFQTSDGWDDLPFDGASGFFTNYKYSETYRFQKFIAYPTMRMFYRITRPSDGYVSMDWTEYTKEETLNTALSTFDTKLFRTGGLYDGVLVPSHTNRICTYPFMLKYPYPVTIFIELGFKYGVTLYNDDETYRSASPALTTTAYTVPSNTFFRVWIGRVDEIPGEDPDFTLFASKLLVSVPANKAIESKTEVIEQIDNGFYRNGSIYAGSITPSQVKRICTYPSILSFDHDLRIDVDAGFMYQIAYYSTSDSFIGDSEWLVSSSIIKAGSRFRISIARVNEIPEETADISTFASKIKLVFDSSVAIEGLMKLNLVNITLNSDFFRTGSIYQGNIVPSHTNRIASYPGMFNYDYELTLFVNAGYRFSVTFYNSNGVYLRDTGFLTSGYVIPKNSYFRVVVAKVEEVSETANIRELLSKIRIVAKLEDINANYNNTVKQYAYFGIGEHVSLNCYRYNVSVIDGVNSTIHTGKAEQGFAVYNGVLFQLYSDDEVEVIDLNTGVIIDDFSVSTGHGNTIDFSNEFYDSEDEFPLAYVTTTADSSDPIVNVIRFTRHSGTLIRQYRFPVASVGYYACHILDPVNKEIFMIGHKENSYYEDPDGTNLTIVSRWDIKNAQIDGGYYIPSFIETFNLPFITTIQGNTMYNNLLAICSSHWANTKTEIIFIDPYRKIICSKWTEFPESVKNVEGEGIAFVKDDNKYFAIIKPGGHTPYYRLDSEF